MTRYQLRPDLVEYSKANGICIPKGENCERGVRLGLSGYVQKLSITVIEDGDEKMISVKAEVHAQMENPCLSDGMKVLDKTVTNKLMGERTIL